MWKAAGSTRRSCRSLVNVSRRGIGVQASTVPDLVGMMRLGGMRDVERRGQAGRPVIIPAVPTPFTPLRDAIGPGTRVLLVGINPGIRSATIGHHFAGYSNRFWKLLYESGLITEPLTAEDDARLPEWGLGITNLIRRPTPGVATLRPEEYVAGLRTLRRKVRRLKPESRRLHRRLAVSGDCRCEGRDSPRQAARHLRRRPHRRPAESERQKRALQLSRDAGGVSRAETGRRRMRRASSNVGARQSRMV